MTLTEHGNNHLLNPVSKHTAHPSQTTTRELQPDRQNAPVLIHRRPRNGSGRVNVAVRVALKSLSPRHGPAQESLLGVLQVVKILVGEGLDFHVPQQGGQAGHLDDGIAHTVVGAVQTNTLTLTKSAPSLTLARLHFVRTAGGNRLTHAKRSDLVLDPWVTEFLNPLHQFHTVSTCRSADNFGFGGAGAHTPRLQGFDKTGLHGRDLVLPLLSS